MRKTSNPEQVYQTSETKTDRDRTRMEKIDKRISEVGNIMKRFAIDETYGNITIEFQAGIVSYIIPAPRIR